MTIYALESETSNITVFPTPEAAVAACQTPFDVFTSQQELAELIANWPAARLLATYNSLPGVKPLKKLKDSQLAAAKIWERVKNLGQTVNTQAEPPAAAAKPTATTKASARAVAAKGAPVLRKTSQKATPAKAARKANKKGKERDANVPRPGSKMLQVISMLQRKNGATITEIMQAMNWQRHTVRGFVAGALKKAGYTVESFKPEAGERSYRLPK